MDKRLVDAINATPFKAYFAITGGGQGFLGDFTAISGASKTFIGGIVPYNSVIFDKFVGGFKGKPASEYGARRLAEASYRECLGAGVSEDYAIGVGASSSVAGDSEREGRVHKLNIACHTYRTTETHCFELLQGRSREEENQIISDVILNLLAFYSSVAVHSKNLLGASQKIRKYDNARVYANISLAHNPCDLLFENGGDNSGEDLVLYPGSFSILHDGHREMYEISGQILNKQPYFEISINNTDKGAINFVDLQDRLLQFGDKYNYVVTNTPRFYDKVNSIRAFTNRPVVFIVGQDTWERIWDAVYDLEQHLLEKFFIDNNVRFLVFGRNGKQIECSFGEATRIKHEKAENYCNPISSSGIRLKSI